ncbi:MAG: FHA domain-containing protein [Vicinamibacteria bacterium]|nr:FHA domain-containing protein [Vicinamibacteria bacterium]
MGGFVRGATLLEGGGTPGGGSSAKGRTIHEDSAGSAGGFGKGRTVVDGPTGGRPKARTVFDPGPSGSAGSRQALPRLTGWLVTFSNEPSGEDYRLREGRNVVGADGAECDVAVSNDGSISAKHAVIMVRDGVMQIRDNDSTNGTYVNGQDVFGAGAVPLQNLDRVRLGNTEFVVYTLKQS